MRSSFFAILASSLFSLTKAVATRLPRSDACSQLAALEPASVVTSADGSAYHTIRKRHWSETAWKRPACIFVPSDAGVLAEGVKILTSTNETFAVRSGGHSPLPNWANTDDGVLITLELLNQVEYSSDTELIRAGTGNQWGRVYDVLTRYGRVAVGARVLDIGFGLLTGGGLSHHSSLYGFPSDNVVEYELVLSNGTVTTVTEHSSAELFWALKAGGTNFGILTHVSLRTYPQQRVWGGIIIYSIEYMDEIMAAIAEYQAVGQLDSKSAILPYVAVNNFNAVFISFVYLDHVDRPDAFRPFYNIPSLSDDTKVHENFSAAISEVVDKVYPRWTWGSTTVYLDNSTYVEIAQLCQTISQSSTFQSMEGATMVLVPQPISKAMVENSIAKGPTPIKLQSREQLWLSINLGWQNAGDDAKMDRVAEDTLSQIEELTKSKGLYDEYVFFNNAHHSQDPIRSFGMNAFRKMKRISRETDSSQVLQTQLAGGFKLGGS